MEKTMAIISIESAQARLPELIQSLRPGETLVITRDDKPVARLTAEEAFVGWPCKAGTAKDKILHIASDFDAPLDEFRDYMG
jgi:antitoxin (DNA-binding transcriptional repressor) of toxin-antitoxin stability system